MDNENSVTPPFEFGLVMDTVLILFAVVLLSVIGYSKIIKTHWSKNQRKHPPGE